MDKYIHLQTAFGGLFYFHNGASNSGKSGLVLFLCPKGGETMKNKKKEKGHYIFRKYIRNPKTGKIIYASDYGKKAFKIWVKD